MWAINAAHRSCAAALLGDTGTGVVGSALPDGAATAGALSPAVAGCTGAASAITAQRGMRVNRLADVDGVFTYFNGQSDLADQVLQLEKINYHHYD